VIIGVWNSQLLSISLAHGRHNIAAQFHVFCISRRRSR
jgi:hypothetical protein